MTLSLLASAILMGLSGFMGAALLLVAWNLYLLPDRLHGVRFSFLC